MKLTSKLFRSDTFRCCTLTLLTLVVLTTALRAEEPAATQTKPAATQTKQEKQSEHYTYRRDHDPNGIGKFYLGREIAHVMGFRGAYWLERVEREQEERLSLLPKALKLQPGMAIADIGAGSGVISVILAEHVSPGGKIYAVDVQQKMLDLLKKKMEKQGIDNVIPVLGTQKSPGLKPESIDMAIMVDVYHEFEFPYEMMQEISKALKPKGRVVLVEYRKEDPSVPIKLVHKMTEAQAKKEVSRPELNLKWKETIGILPRQHILVFEKTTEE
ncbi:putative methyltransferase YcgJ [Gimesia panareensis]|uniref:Putative methyltransferase YcgJ n=1 Tax=Gimesia panareensis TaxID=2527978 RepID=A0A517Q2E3_9PLAN|nr:class I SAM-dependent methyltransferase [Gimesia panareensis]QDT25803.1 putative methyltransferase YcgJ [Gimesia panareensis]